MKIYEFDYGVAKDWVVAPDKEDAIKELLSFTGGDEGDWDKITVVSEKDLDNSYMLDVEEYFDDEDIPEEDEHLYSCGYKIIKSFKQARDEAIESGISEYLASTEW